MRITLTVKLKYSLKQLHLHKVTNIFIVIRLGLHLQSNSKQLHLQKYKQSQKTCKFSNRQLDPEHTAIANFQRNLPLRHT